MFFFKKRKEELKTEENQKNNVIRLKTAHGIEEISYTLLRDNFKTLRLRILPLKTSENNSDKTVRIEVRAPKRYAQKHIDAFLQKKALWILENKEKYQDRESTPDINFSHGKAFFCLGREFSFFYKHSAFIKNMTFFLQSKELGKKELGEMENLPIHKEKLETQEPSFVKEMHETRKKDYAGNFLCQKWHGKDFIEKSFFQIFLEMAEQKNFSLKIQKMPDGQSLPILLIQTKSELPSNLRFLPLLDEETKSLSEFLATDFLPKKYEKLIKAWRKKTADLFLQACFDRVWQGLCGEIPHNSSNKYTDKHINEIPSEIQKFFRAKKKPCLKVKKLSRRFGSCSTKTKENTTEITLACHLISFPLGLIEYIIIHECCHLMHMNHSKNFYKVMNMCCEGVIRKRKLLHEWSRTHAQF